MVTIAGMRHYLSSIISPLLWKKDADGYARLMVSSADLFNVNTGAVECASGVETTVWESSRGTNVRWRTGKLFCNGLGGLSAGKVAIVRVYAKVGGSYTSLPADQESINKNDGLEIVIDELSHFDDVKVSIEHDEGSAKNFELEGIGWDLK